MAMLIEDQAVRNFFGRICGAALMGLVCIWFGDEMGGWMGTFHLHSVTAPSPGGMVRFMGWLLLFLPYVAFIIYK